ncbi:hypothetical protein HAX54_045249 [Datura stramonium]|uniref:Uncharacterized protein n=1 Tax=Datura stramonium TaxID=4076 RepID=A0ABS8RH55_DATST|nr:hypothetical protein [Datura stramonium]
MQPENSIRHNATSISSAASLYLQGFHRQKLALPRHSSRQTNLLLWGTLPRQSPVRCSHKNLRLRSRIPAKIRAVVSGDVSSLVDEGSGKVQEVAEKVIHLYRVCLQDSATAELLVQTKVSNQIIGETYEPESLGSESFLTGSRKLDGYIIEVGPRLSFTTAWSANAVSIFQACGLTEINRMERSRRYLLYVNGSLQDSQINEFASMFRRRSGAYPSWKGGRKALEEINEEMGLAFDEQDLQYYTKLFRDDIKRNPTNVELFDIAQSNNRQKYLLANPNNSVIGFKDNSSAIKGFPVKQLRPIQPGSTCPLDTITTDLDVLFTAETHNFPCAVAPYPGAETGAGGRIRDTHATGRGSFVVASTAGYCVGNLNIEGSYAPWEDPFFTYPANLVPLQILIDASNGASDYGNKFVSP